MQQSIAPASFYISNPTAFEGLIILRSEYEWWRPRAQHVMVPDRRAKVRGQRIAVELSRLIRGLQKMALNTNRLKTLLTPARRQCLDMISFQLLCAVT